MTGGVERFSADSLLPPGRGARVMAPTLGPVPAHWHDYYELCLVVSGSGRHVVNGDPGRVGPGSAFLLSPADFHALEPDDPAGLECLNVVVDPAAVEPELLALGPAAASLPWQAAGLADLEPDVRRLARELDEPGPGSERLVAALLACLVVELARAATTTAAATTATTTAATTAAPSGDRGGWRADLDAAVLHVDRHFREPLTLAQVAGTAHLSANWFSERFREHTGTSFQRYLQDRRLAFARSLLASTPLSVSEVCHAAGFGSLSHFGRAFRRRYGVPPSDAGLRHPGVAVPGTPGGPARDQGPGRRSRTGPDVMDLTATR